MNPSHKNESNQLLAQAIKALRSADYGSAIVLSEKLIGQQENHAKAHAVLFSSLFKSEKFEQARQMGGKAASLNPESLYLLNNQACLQLDAKQPAAAAALLRSLISQFGERAQWLYNLGLAQRMVGNYDNAIKAFRNTLDHDPTHDRAAYQLAECYQTIGSASQASLAFSHVRLLRSQHAQSNSQYIAAAVNSNSISPSELQTEITLWADQFIPKEIQSSEIDYTEDQDAPLKISFIIADLPALWISRMVVPVLNSLVAQQVSVQVLLQGSISSLDACNDSVEQIETRQLSDADFVGLVRDNKTEVLIDLCGMAPGNRQYALASKIAEHQVSWLGHQGIIASSQLSILEPELGKNAYAILTPNDQRSPSTDSRTFYAIGTALGVSDKVIRVWAELLHQRPGWQIHFDVDSKNIEASLRQRMKKRGVDASRLSFDAQIKASKGSIVLDNFDHNDPIASYQAIESEANLVALRGAFFPAQATARLLHQMDLDETIQDSVRNYIDHALALASEEPLAEDGEEPSAKEDKEPSAKEGEEPSAKEDKEPSAKEGKKPSAKEGKKPSAKEGKKPSAKEGKKHSHIEDFDDFAKRFVDAVRKG